MYKIILEKKNQILKVFIIDKPAVAVGRLKNNDIVLKDKSVSDKHCIIKLQDGKLVIEDKDSAFGTKVNGVPVQHKEIAVNDIVQIGEYILKIKPEKEEGAAYLLGIQGRLEGKKFELNPDVTKIGRSEEFNDIWISKDIDKSVSRRHATITGRDGDYILTDKRSRNRTFVNKKQVNEDDEVTLQNKDEILIGRNIFRFITDNKDDFSPPKKAGIFWKRLMPKIKKAAALILLAGGIYAMVTGFRGLGVINDKPERLEMEAIKWASLERRGAFDFRENADITPSPAVGDINGDGTVEAVFTDGSGKVYAYDGKTGNLIWKQKIGSSRLTSPVIEDLNNDGIDDVIAGSDDSKVYALDGAAGEYIYISDFLGGRVLFASSPLVKDLDGDGFKDIVVTTDDNVVAFLFSPASAYHRPYYFRTPEGILSSPVLMKKGLQKAVAIATNGGKLYLFDAANPESREVIDITRMINVREGTNLVLNELASSPAVSDLNGDGVDDIVLTSSAYYVIAVNGMNNSLLWLYKITPYSALASPRRYPSCVVTDYSDFGEKAVVLGWVNGKIMALSAATGEVLWKYSLGDEKRIISSVALADFNKDKATDSVFVDEDGRIILVRGGAHTSGDALLDSQTIGKRITATPCIADMNGDGKIDIIVNSEEGDIYLMRTPTTIFKNNILWAGFRGGPANEGSLTNIVYNSGRYTSYIYAGIGIILLILIFSFIAVKRKKAGRPGTVIIKK